MPEGGAVVLCQSQLLSCLIKKQKDLHPPAVYERVLRGGRDGLVVKSDAVLAEDPGSAPSTYVTAYSYL